MQLVIEFLNFFLLTKLVVLPQAAPLSTFQKIINRTKYIGSEIYKKPPKRTTRTARRGFAVENMDSNEQTESKLKTY